ncbi:hypothetical protein HQO12_13435 [Rhodococcus fascians]|uniref:hypothetical protein n=1 Tax=Rhodococcoides fascians TaxID=1828 RepID=UPI00195A1D0A|nr:hypothetical protein [Rhodococcus fascians]MBM7243448.1 hypothetical protein [Rhodococcus fascians]MBY3809905.1 hypothetical protein [Rhodococcus fascians]MBY3841408.1 hypothetical protein [Rhodococcus fascians]MBY3844923.1 hypothetical protein [Rhodococcus fascians]MBY3850614.1 hypothetical protein [Rhodococcus fascians]
MTTDRENLEAAYKPRTYEGRPVEAVRVGAHNAALIVEWLMEQGVATFDRDGAVSFGHDVADVGDWIIYGRHPRVEVISEEAFAASFYPEPLT